MPQSFSEGFIELFDRHFVRLFRYLDRLSGDPDLAGDIAQDAFVKLFERGSFPDTPEAWLITVATNLFRNVRSTEARRLRLLTPARGSEVLGDAPPAPDASIDATESQRGVRQAIDRLPERERQLLLLRAEGYSYHDIALALELNEASVGTLLARAKQSFRGFYEEAVHAPRG